MDNKPVEGVARLDNRPQEAAGLGVALRADNGLPGEPEPCAPLQGRLAAVAGFGTAGRVIPPPCGPPVPRKPHKNLCLPPVGYRSSRNNGWVLACFNPFLEVFSDQCILDGWFIVYSQ